MDRYWEKITEINEEQKKKGLKHYKTTIEDSSLSLIESLRMLEEEMIDALNYIEKIKDIVEKNGDE